jgi:hypothetical protein
VLVYLEYESARLAYWTASLEFLSDSLRYYSSSLQYYSANLQCKKRHKQFHLQIHLELLPIFGTGACCIRVGEYELGNMTFWD